MSKIISLPQLAWQNPGRMDLPIPEEWNVRVCRMTGHDSQSMTASQIQAAIQAPIAIPALPVLATDKKRAVIIFDDMSRATRTDVIVTCLLEELAAAGIADENIIFMGATGCHSPMNRTDFVKKLGEAVVRRFPVFSHNAFGNCRNLGRSAAGLEIEANAEVMACDLKIAIGSVVPHNAAGFGGGAKIILPGICSFGTNAAFHQFEKVFRANHPLTPENRKEIEGNATRGLMEEAMDRVGLDFMVNTLMNSLGETVAVYAGAPKAVFARAVREAARHYSTIASNDNDIVIANSYAKVNEPEVGLSVAFASVKNGGGDIVLICHAPEGHIAHYLFGPWGLNPTPSQTRINIPARVNHIYVWNNYPELSFTQYFKQPEKVIILADWEAVLQRLSESAVPHPQVAVYPNADIEYLVQPQELN
jgi:lactate racemase